MNHRFMFEWVFICQCELYSLLLLSLHALGDCRYDCQSMEKGCIQVAEFADDEGRSDVDHMTLPNLYAPTYSCANLSLHTAS